MVPKKAFPPLFPFKASCKVCFLTLIAQPVSFCNILDKCEQEEHLFLTQSALPPRLKRKLARRLVWWSTATMQQSWAAQPANEWQPPVKFILARGGPCWLLTKVCGLNPKQHNIILPPESQQLPKCSVVGELAWVISDWTRPLSTGAVKAL